MADLDVITPPSRTVPFRGKALSVAPLRLQQIGPFVTASRTIIARVAMMVGAVEGAPAAAAGAILLDLLEQDSAELAAALAVAICPEVEWIPGAGLDEALNQKAAWIGGGTLDEIADLLEAVVGLNRDFFAHRLRSLLLQTRPPAEENLASPTSSST
ncbi:hypothetical protein [Bacillus toyonensis]|uniref:hypothetical protein n=1 Tax=Bacillus toyonensis TaxID=155322 RepID=UPI00130FC300|nr:hypothetical protein [Stenotrophomonas maltophilia]MBH1504412.1 hypothetical protein [Stenotrophomonas maltophilia]MBH1783988.1 hypothetical protein [Stenotrophomonas maltophilia]